MAKPNAARAVATRLLSRRLTDGPGSVFGMIRETKIEEMAARIADSNPYVTMDDELFRQTVLGITLRDKSFCVPPAEADANARSSRFSEQNNRFVLDDVSDAIALMSAREKLEHDASGKIPTRFDFRQRTAKTIGEALALMSPKERVAYQSGAGIPERIKIVQS